MNNANKLPQSYRQDVESNNYKMLQLIRLAVEDLAIHIEDVESCLDINNAYGETLDLYGKMYNEFRENRNDEEYRLVIKAAMEKGRCSCDCNSIIKILAQIFGCQTEEILLSEKSSFSVEIRRLPFELFKQNNISAQLAVEIVQSFFPICVTADEDVLHGTFEFSDNANDYDESAGFGNVEQSIGGCFGLISN